MPSKSQNQRGFIFSKRRKYESKEKAPKKWKLVFEEGWQNKGKLPKKVKKIHENFESDIEGYNQFLNEEVGYAFTKQVSQCYHGCQFFETSMDGMECNHPYFKYKGAYDNMIITQDNSHNRVPDDCPLRDGPVEIITIISLKKPIITKEDPYGEEDWEK